MAALPVDREVGEEEKEKMESKSEAATEKEKMKPWEQHAGVINMPRFDYNAPSALLHHSHSGFLITCSIKREKSATKEAMSILEKYAESYSSGSSKSLERSDENKSAKKRRILTDETSAKSAEDMKSESIIEEIDGGLAKQDCLSLAKADAPVERGFVLSLVKLTRSGLVLLTSPRENPSVTTDVVSNIFRCLESGILKSPLWCHRIFPIQATCLLIEKELQTVVSKLVLQFINDKQNKLARPVKVHFNSVITFCAEHMRVVGSPYRFAVGYNRRGIEETCMKNLKGNPKDSDPFPMLDRSKCFDVVASAIKDVVPESAVDLKSPELTVLVELLPLSGVPNESLVAAVAVLPQNLVSVKPRLCIKPLITDANARNRS
ncbi:hypothetical protein DKX38_015521 [Salix brachista]|uniref:THUMP domain-containing protein n=1 Tax=Salix brachista TaxID=2182728 RepID=A0A5N5L638_9ROSI|nr:hypothetical protein DKX38_015521 [Salix brachista]